MFVFSKGTLFYLVPLCNCTPTRHFLRIWSLCAIAHQCKTFLCTWSHCANFFMHLGPLCKPFMNLVPLCKLLINLVPLCIEKKYKFLQKAFLRIWSHCAIAHQQDTFYEFGPTVQLLTNIKHFYALGPTVQLFTNMRNF